MTIPEAIARLYQLRVDTTTTDGDGAPHEKPHKPRLLLAVSEPLEWGANCDRKQTKPTTDEPETEKLRCAAPPFIDPLRLNGEKELSELAGKSLLLPEDPAFYPNEAGLK